ncbi:MAG: TPM domain-containing protein [Opitutaceae bacterium]
MQTDTFLSALDHTRIERAIVAAELRTSGEFRVVIHHQAAADPMETARLQFEKLQMHRTHERNAVLLLVAPKSQTFAIYGDVAIHAKCGDAFWTEISTAIGDHFKNGRFTDGIVHAIDRAGTVLATHFPRRPDDKNELPDAVIDGGTVI